MPTQLEFDYYCDRPVPGMPLGYQARHRPVAEFVTLHNPSNPRKTYDLLNITLDSGCEITLFYREIADVLAIDLISVQPTIWRGQSWQTWFGTVELESTDSNETFVWTATASFVGFRKNLLGRRGCLEFLDAHFLGPARKVILVATPTFPGTTTAPLET